MSSVPQQAEPAVCGGFFVVFLLRSVDCGKEAGYNLPEGVGNNGGVVSALEVADGSDQPGGDPSKAGVSTALCTKAPARPRLWHTNLQIY